MLSGVEYVQIEEKILLYLCHFIFLKFIFKFSENTTFRLLNKKRNHLINIDKFIFTRMMLLFTDFHLKVSETN